MSIIETFKCVRLAGFNSENMSQAIHFIGTDIDSARFSQSVVRADIPADKVVILYERDQPGGEEFVPAWVRMKEDFEDFDIATEELAFSDSEYWGIEFKALVKRIYERMVESYNDGGNLFINISSEPYQVSYALLYAASTLLKKTDGANDKETLGWDRINFYVTNGRPHHWDTVTELSKLSRGVQSVETTVERQRRITDKLVQEINQLEQHSAYFTEIEGFEFEIDDDEAYSLASELNNGWSAEQIQELESEITDFLKAYRNLQYNATELSNDTLFNELSASDLSKLVGNDQIAELIHRITNSNEFASSKDQKKSSGPFLVTEGELDSIGESMREMELRLDDIGEAFENNVVDATHDLLVDQGRSGPGRVLTFSPQPIGTPTNTQVAILFALEVNGSTDSITELLEQLIDIGYQLYQNDIVEEDSSLDVDRLKGLRDAISPSLRSKIQYNLNQLEENGYISKEQQGRASAIHPTENAQIWMATHGYDNMEEIALPVRTAFDDITSKVEKELEAE